jgi:hypothetical protein
VEERLSGCARIESSGRVVISSRYDAAFEDDNSGFPDKTSPSEVNAKLLSCRESFAVISKWA